MADNLSGMSKLSEVRTSSGMFISKGKVASLFISCYMDIIISCSCAQSFCAFRSYLF